MGKLPGTTEQQMLDALRQILAIAWELKEHVIKAKPRKA
jgi:hypothetical protein